ncbi:hypothetical protein BH09PSE2_BH09PSE2_23530 [soil metagenome]
MTRRSPIRAPARSGLTLALCLALGLNGAVAPLAFAASSGTPEIAVGVGRGFSQLVLHGEREVRRDGVAVVVRFPGAGPNLARLHVDPPPFLKSADAVAVSGGVDVRLVPADGAILTLGRADGAQFINLRSAPEAEWLAKEQPAPPRPDPAPPCGVRMAAAFKAGVLTLKFPWRGPVGAAAFRRGDGVWVVFDAKAKLDLAGAPHGLPQARRFDAVDGADFAAVRITAPESAALSLVADGATWVLTLGGPPPPPPPAVAIARDEDGSAALIARLPGASGVFWLSDPQVGDRLAVVTAGPQPSQGSPRSFVDARVLGSAHGLALQPVADDLTVSTEGDRVRIVRPKGLARSPVGAAGHGATPPPPHTELAEALDLPKAATLPGLVDFAAWSQTGEQGFLHRYDALLAAAAEEGSHGKGAPMDARLGLARFLVGSELAEEAIGVLDTLAKTDPAVTGSAEFRGLRGASRVMARRWKDAQADFSAPSIAADPAAALWRSYAAAKEGDFASAKSQFASGRIALDQVAPVWRARFAIAAAGAAVASGDAGAARTFLSAGGDGATPEDVAEQALVRARIAEREGRAPEALALYEGLSNDRYGAVAAPALLKAMDLKLATGRIKTDEAIATLDSIRFRWRGDATELEVVRELGQVNLRQGRYREALEAWRSAGSRMPDLPAASAIRADLAQAFRDLFLAGRADGLEPVQALALFYDFKTYAPIGAEGDLMVRRLVRRLVDVDLLGQAADLLKYQVDNRLDGAAKAQVSTDLALIYLMDRKPEDALGAINGSRSTLLPTALNGQRRLLEARALVDLGRFDHALEVIGTDQSPDALEVRALCSWRARDWAGASKTAEQRLGDRWKRNDPLTSAEAAMLLRAGVGYSLANDDAGLTRLRDHYLRLTDTAPNAEPLKVALTGLNTAPGAGLAAAMSDTDTFAGWVGRMKARFRSDAAAPPPVSKQQQAQAGGPAGAQAGTKRG